MDGGTDLGNIHPLLRSRPFILLWALGRERILHTFEVEASVLHLKLSFIRSLIGWSRALGSRDNLNVVFFIDFLFFVRNFYSF
jgi:hypothetical protein